ALVRVEDDERAPLTLQVIADRQARLAGTDNNRLESLSLLHVHRLLSIADTASVGARSRDGIAAIHQSAVEPAWSVLTTRDAPGARPGRARTRGRWGPRARKAAACRRCSAGAARRCAR